MAAAKTKPAATAPTTIPFEIKNRWSGEVMLTAQIACSPDDLPSVKLGLAVRWAVKEGANLVRANLEGANLRGANLEGANLRGANLDGANLEGANLVRANLYGANLYGANLEGANLRGANLDGANLRGASLDGANLVRANLDGANLRGANLDGANLRGANLRGMGDMRFVKTLQVERWAIAYTADVLQIGCQTHPIADWWSFDDGRINAMDSAALEWWSRWKPILRQIIEASPAEPTGYVAAEVSA